MAVAAEDATPGIGLLNEKALHASLKTWYAQPGDRFEVAVDGFVIDIVRGGELFEIQTRSPTAIRSKLTRLLASHRIRLIYPIAQEKWIVRLPSGRQRASRRKSPRRGRFEDLFWDLIGLPRLFTNRNLSLEVLLIREEEARRYAGKRKSWRRKGWVTEERRLLEVVDRRVFEKPSDWLAFLPASLETFTTADLARATGLRRDLAQRMAYFLRHARVIDLVGRRGRCHVYRVAESSQRGRADAAPA